MTKRMRKLREVVRTHGTNLVTRCIEEYGETFFRIADAFLKRYPKLMPYDAMLASSHAICIIAKLGGFSPPAFPEEIQSIPLVWVADLGEIDAQKKASLDRRVSELEFSVRASNCLQNNGITYVGELVQKTEVELREVRALGKKTMREIISLLREEGLSLDMKLIGWVRPTV